MSDSENSIFSEEEEGDDSFQKDSDAEEGSPAGSADEAEEGEEADDGDEEPEDGEDLMSEPRSEDDEEEEEDDEEVDRRKKPKKRKVESFIIDEADVDDDYGEDDEEDEWEAGAEALINNAPTDYNDSDQHGARRLTQLFSTQKEDELEEYYKRKYAEGTSTSYRDEDELPDSITQQGLLPGVKDPNLWMVKCTIGQEKEVAIQLMRKFIAYQNTEEPLQIKSIVAVEGLKGYVYIESYKQTHVKQAINGVGMLRIGQWTQKMVPIKEMTDVLKVVKETAMLKGKAWVRLKRGVYKDDLGQVDYVDQTQNQVILKLLPRIDYNRPRGIQRTAATAAEKRKRRRPEQKLFDIEAIRRIGGDVTSDGDFLVFEGNRYSRKGFLFKTFAMSAIIAEGIKPTLSELERFEDKPEDIDVELVARSKSSKEKSHSFAPGDNVEVVEGELIHLQGKVKSVDGNTILVLPKHEDLKDTLEFPAHELRKHFKIGDHVKVIAGRYEGDTGLVVRVEDNLAIVFSDLTMHEMKVLPRDLQLCQEMSTGVDSLGQFQLGDLVQLDPQTVGSIVRLEKETFQVLNMHNKLVQVKPQAVTRKKDSRHAVALDAEQNNLQVKDIVKVIDGPHSGREGEVKHIYRNYAFLHSRLMTENGGVFVVRNRHIVLAGGSRKTDGYSTGFTPMSPRITSPMHPSGGGQQQGPGAGGPGGGGRGRGRVGRDRELIGQTVRITKGPFKGHIGIVKDATESTARIELHSTCKTINVDRGRMNIVSDQVRSGMTTAYSRNTPMYGSQTPMYGSGSRTPMYGSQTPLHDGGGTPHYGSMTPSRDGSMTPSRSGAWDPTAPSTPMSFDESSPSPQPYGSTTPGTPGYSGEPQSPGQGPYTPATPNSSSGMYGSESTYSPYGGQTQSPSPGSYQPTPSPSSSFQPAPSPGSYQATPSPSGTYHTPSPGSYQGNPSPLGYSANTPMAPSPLGYNPQTPGGDIMHPAQSDWHTQDIMVRIKDSHDDPSLIFKEGVIRSVQGPLCSVYLPDGEDRVVTVKALHLEPVMPSKTDRVKVIMGDDRESTGTLINIDAEDGIVKMDLGAADIKILQLKMLAKLYK
ncbi:transcription elongation factor SPT5 [Strongylocentrotus purpuratus]|uniref:Transcription elongation factor SPT5 n=1 Tax=Strongylocentrotus purpuratus TaxID=7668 RepID=A0A7M7PBC6_STRPU|nr:transcription elongation factor SPT5 [Strongylocentrotus purpuratus]|eukprot:XP_003728680.1 PREDICTED: transcription elongation factor SPT5 isoform X1 [Strongylocentrotus purpuratus]